MNGEIFYIEKLGYSEELPISHSCKSYISEYDVNKDSYQHGAALDKDIYYNEYHNNFIATNGEYSIIVKFCPWCGIELKK